MPTTTTRITRFGLINCYLVQEEDGLTLIDTAIGGSARSILAAAARMDGPIRRVVLTHAHADHAGGLDELVAQLPGVTFLCGEQTARFLQGDRSLAPEQALAPLRGGFVASGVTPQRRVGDGDRVGSLEVIATPGHSPDHLAFFDRRDGTVYAGDALQTQGGLAVAGDLRWLFPLPALATWHRPTALASAKRIAGLNPNRLAVGHGKELSSPAQALQRAIARAERKFRG